MGDTETAMCSLHNKTRSLTVLELDGEGNYVCMPTEACKTHAQGGGHQNRDYSNFDRKALAPYAPSPPAPITPGEDQGICIIHHKARSWSCLADNGYGTYRCFPPHTCKGGEMLAAFPVLAQMGGGGKGRSRNHGGGMKGGQGSAMCSLHNKKRSTSNLQEGYGGQMECIPGLECKTGGEDDLDALPPPPGDSNESYVCSLHGKTRSLSVMVEDGMGGYQCGSNYQCKVAGGRSATQRGNYHGYPPVPAFAQGGGSEFCSLHNKRRSVSCLVEDGVGGMQCRDEHQCK